MTKFTWSTAAKEELSLRIAPLREAWEARGPGLLKAVADRIGPQQLPGAVRIVPVMPTTNGGGTIDRNDAAVYIQAVLVNPIAQLPEVSRLAWLICRLTPTADVPDRIGALALVPAVLEAAAEVDLLQFDDVTLKLALEFWCDVESARLNVVGETLSRWWNHRHTSHEVWATQVADLGRMLEDFYSEKGEACDFS